MRNALRLRGASVPSSLAWKRSSKEPEWLKDIDVSRTVENLLTGAVVFVGRLPTTAWWLLSRPGKLDRRLLFNESLKTVPQVNATRPLTFLAVNLFLYAVLMLKTIGTIQPFSPFLEFFKPFLAKVPTDLKSLSLESVSVFMLPGVVIVGFLSATTTSLARAVGMKAPFKVMLNLHAYYVGLACFIITVQALLLTPTWELIFWGQERYGKDGIWYAIPLVLSGIAFLLALLVTVIQFVTKVREALLTGVAIVIALLATSWTTGFALAWAILYFVSPAFELIGK
ncbi:MAG: hypothetical protein ABI702_16895 [Burkholderiales bacterium]